MPVVRNPQFYFREGFCWIDVNSTYLKARLKKKGVFDVLSMSLFSMTEIPDWYYVGIINSEFISLYVDNFINNTSHFQINDARQLPIIIPSKDILESINKLTSEAINIKCNLFKDKITTEQAELCLYDLQQKIDELIRSIYNITN